MHRTQAIRMKLGGSPSLIEDFPPKPKGMQWRTYRATKATGRGCGEPLLASSVQTDWASSLLKGKKKGFHLIFGLFSNCKSARGANINLFGVLIFEGFSQRMLRIKPLAGIKPAE